MLDHILGILAKWIASVISTGGYFGIVFLMAVESACIPLPSELIMPFAGALTTMAFAASLQHEPLNIHLVSLAGAFGCAVGSAIAYWVGSMGGREFVDKYGKYILLKHKDVQMAEVWFQKQGLTAIFVSRLLPIVRTFISLPAGIAKMNFWSFLALSFLGSVPWCYLLAYFGVLFANHLEDLKKYFHGIDIVIAVIIIAGFGYYVWHHLKPEKPTASPPAASPPAED